MKTAFRITAFAIFILLIAANHEARADCAAPYGTAGAITWNGTNAVIWCDGVAWHSLADTGSKTLAALTDVDAGGISNGKVLTYNSTSSKWEAASPSSTTPAGTVAGAVQFRGSSPVFAADDANLVWDNTNKRLGIGTATLGTRVEIVGPASTDSAARFVLRVADDAAMAAGVGGGIGFRGKFKTDGTLANGGYIYSPKSNAADGDYGFDLAFGTRPSVGNPTERMRITGDGKVGIGTSTPETSLHIRRTTGPDSLGHPYRVGVLVEGENGNVGGRIGLRDSSPTDDGPWILGYRSRGTLSASQAVQTNDLLLGMLAIPHDGTGWNWGSHITFNASENWTGTSHGADIRFMVNQNGTISAPKEAMRIANNGNIGIGTASPQKQLDVAGAGAFGTANFPASAYVQGNLFVSANSSGAPATSGTTQPNLALRVTNPGGATLDTGVYPSGVFWQQVTNITDLAKNYALVLNPNGGNVGIGTATPASRLHVLSTAPYSPGSVTASYGQTIIGIQSFPNWGANGLAISNANTGSSWAMIGVNGDRLYFGHTNGTDAVPDVVISSNGALPGDMTVYANAYKPGGGAWLATSDIRLKHIDGTYDHGLGSIVRLEPVRFHYKANNARNEPSDRPFIGLVAQDVQKVFPEAVEMGTDGYLSLDATPISFAMINAIKELKADNDNLRAALKVANDHDAVQDAAIDALRKGIDVPRAAR